MRLTREDRLLVETIIFLSLLRLLLVRCKILRLYLAGAVIVLIGSAVILCVDKPKEWSGNLRKTDDEPLPMRKKGLWRYGERSGLDIIFTFFFDET